MTESASSSEPREPTDPETLEPKAPGAEKPKSALGSAAFAGRWHRSVDRLVRPSLLDRVDRDHRQPDHAFRRRRVVSLITLAIGTALLGLASPSHPAMRSSTC